LILPHGPIAPNSFRRRQWPAGRRASRLMPRITVTGHEPGDGWSLAGNRDHAGLDVPPAPLRAFRFEVGPASCSSSESRRSRGASICRSSRFVAQRKATSNVRDAVEIVVELCVRGRISTSSRPRSTTFRDHREASPRDGAEPINAMGSAQDGVTEGRAIPRLACVADSAERAGSTFLAHSILRARGSDSRLYRVVTARGCTNPEVTTHLA